MLPKLEEFKPKELTWVETHSINCSWQKAFAFQSLLKRQNSTPDCNYAFKRLRVQMEGKVNESYTDLNLVIFNVHDQRSKKATCNEGGFRSQETVVIHLINERKESS